MSRPPARPYIRLPGRYLMPLAGHVVTREHVHVITSTVPEQVPASDIADARLVWIDADGRGVELEIVALDLEDTRRTP